MSRDSDSPTRDVDNVTNLDTTCDAPARIHGVAGPITLGRCFLGTGHAGPHAAPVERMTWGGEADQIDA